jgi:uncharacterized protein
MNLRDWTERHPLIAYFGLTYVITWMGILLFAGVARFQGLALPMAAMVPILLVMLMGPSCASLILIAVTEGQAGLRHLWTRMRRWQVAPQWYMVALLTTPFVTLAVLLTLSTLVSSAYTPGFNLLFGLIVGGLAGFFEEIGWTGFATPRLLQRYGVLASGLVIGLLWGCWHMLAGFMGSVPGQEAFWAMDFFLFWVVLLTAYRILMTWVYSHTQSVLVAQLMHAFFSGTFVAFGPQISQAQTLLYDVSLAASFWVLVAILALSGFNRAATKPAPGSL